MLLFTWKNKPYNRLIHEIRLCIRQFSHAYVPCLGKGVEVHSSNIELHMLQKTRKPSYFQSRETQSSSALAPLVFEPSTKIV